MFQLIQWSFNEIQFGPKQYWHFFLVFFFVCVPHDKESHTCLERHDGKYMMTCISFVIGWIIPYTFISKT